MTTTMNRPETYVGDVPAGVLTNFAACREVAWDIETSGLDSATDRIATCQLANRAGRVLLVRIDGSRPANLVRLLGSPDVLKVFHYAVFDLSFMWASWGARAANVACTKVCSRLLTPGRTEHSLKSILAEHLGVVIDKSQRLSNWFAVALTDAQAEYAANDVIHLPKLLDALKAKLKAKGLCELTHECFRHIPARVTLETGHFGDVFTY
jgi:ribonuclease D